MAAIDDFSKISDSKWKWKDFEIQMTVGQTLLFRNGEMISSHPGPAAAAKAAKRLSKGEKK